MPLSLKAYKLKRNSLKLFTSRKPPFVTRKEPLCEYIRFGSVFFLPSLFLSLTSLWKSCCFSMAVSWIRGVPNVFPKIGMCVSATTQRARNKQGGTELMENKLAHPNTTEWVSKRERKRERKACLGFKVATSIHKYVYPAEDGRWSNYQAQAMESNQWVCMEGIAMEG